MAAQMQRTKRGYNRRSQMMSDINVTPFVDVMLVLLIIFMVTAPLLTVGIPVDLPKTKAKGITDNVEPLVISVQGDGKIFLQETELELVSLVPRLRAITREKPDTKIYIRGDRHLQYGNVMKVMGYVNEAGFQKVALLADLPKPDSKDKK